VRLVVEFDAQRMIGGQGHDARLLARRGRPGTGDDVTV